MSQAAPHQPRCEAFEVLNDETKKDVERVVPMYQKAWSLLDPDARGFIPSSQLERLVRSLPGPFGVPFPHPTGGSDHADEVQACYKELTLKSEFVRSNLPAGDASFSEVLFLLIMFRRIETGEMKGRQYTREVKHLQAALLIHSRLRIYLSRIRIKLKRKRAELMAERELLSPSKGAGWGDAVATREEERKALPVALSGPSGQPGFEVADEVML